MRARTALACLVGVVLGACSSSNPGSALNIVPSGTVEVTGPTTFSAELVNLTGDVTWAVNGGGTISSTAGLHVTYAPPPGTGAATLTATLGGITTTVMIKSGPSVLTSKTISVLKAPVTVLYDAQDIPHIKCAGISDCLAVQGYLQARDRFFPMDFLRHVARAKLAEMIGLGGLSQDVQLRALFTTRAGHRLEDDLTAALDASTAALMSAYVAGVNAHIAELRTGAPLPGEYAQLLFPITAADPMDLPDWTLQDTLAIARLQQFQLSSTLTEESDNGQFLATYGQGPLQDLGKVNAWIRSAAPPTERAHTLSETATRAVTAQRAGALPRTRMAGWQDVLAQTAEGAKALDLALRPAGAAVGSNNWVISADKSATGVAMVANDPHLALQYPPLFHLAVMTSSNAADNLDLAGGSFPGLPGALVGRGAHVGWGVTVVGYDVTDLYLEQFLPQDTCPGALAGPPCVLFNHAPVSTLPIPQTYRVRVGSGGANLVDANTLLPVDSRPPAAVLIVPHHGPIIQKPDAAGKGVSVRWTGQEGNTQDIKAILGLNTAVDVNAAITALKGFSTGAQNFVLADDKGHIAYDPHALVPVRRFTEGVVAPQNLPWFPLPGDGTAEWGDGVHDCASATAAPVDPACWISDDNLPHGTDPAKGYFFTANADPTQTGASDDNDPLTPQPYLSHSWDDSSGFRATRIEQRIAAAIAARGKVSLADMESIQADHVSRPGALFAPIIAALPAGPPELAAAQRVIADWAAAGLDCPSGLTGTDPKASAVDSTPAVMTNSAGCYLFHAFLRALITNVFTDDLAVAKQSVNGLQALKAIIFMLDPAVPPDQTKFCNDVGAAGQLVAAHTCTEQVAIALAQAYGGLVRQVGSQPSSWVWGRVHTMQPVSLLALVITGFEPGPYARPGGAFTVDVGTPALSGLGTDFAFTSSGNVRHISLMDPAKPVVRMQLPGPERDSPVASPGPDLLGQWVKNTYFDFAFGSQIDGVAVSTQSFQAP
jgi:penicillin G amidase